MTKSHSEDLGVFLVLLDIGRNMCRTEFTPSPLADILRDLCIKSVKSAHAVQILTWNGYGGDACTVTRTIFESYISAAYLEHHPQLCEDYSQFTAVKLNRHFQARKTQDGAAFPDEAKLDYLAPIVKDWNDRGMPKTKWYKSDLRQMAQDIDSKTIDQDDRGSA